MGDSCLCPVCGWPALEEPSYDRYQCASFEICPSCGTEFGNDDANRSHQALRMAWIEAGCKWWSTTTPAPDDWNAALQLARAGLLQ